MDGHRETCTRADITNERAETKTDGQRSGQSLASEEGTKLKDRRKDNHDSSARPWSLLTPIFQMRFTEVWSQPWAGWLELGPLSLHLLPWCLGPSLRGEDGARETGAPHARSKCSPVPPVTGH